MNRTVWQGALVLLLAAGLRPVTAAPEDPVLRLAFDGDLKDSSGHGNDAFTASGRFEAGQRNQALLVGGAPATVADCAALRLAPGLRLEGWVKFAGPTTAGQALVTKEREYMLRTDPAGEGGNFSFFVFLTDWEPRVKSPVVPQVGQWYHWIAGWDGRQMTLEVNGQVSRVAREGQALPAGDPLVLGPLSGLLDEVSLVNPGARQAGVAHWAFDGDLRDDTGRGHDLTAPGAQFVAGRADRAIQCGPALSVPDHEDLRLAPGLRLDCTVRFDRLPPSYGYLAIKDGEYQLRVDSPQEGGRFSFFVNLGGWEPRVQSPVKAEVGVWYRLIARWDGEKLTLDVNGQRTELVRSGLAKPGDQPLVLGQIAGQLDDLRVENARQPLLRLRALTQAQTLLRAGRPERLSAVVENLGSPAAAASATLTLGSGVTCQGDPQISLGDLPTGAAKEVSWTVQAAESVSSSATVQLASGTYRAAVHRRALAFFGAATGPVVPTPPQVNLPATPGTTWYVDSVAGDNQRAGTSPETAWRDFTRINGKTLGAGERLLIKRGSVINQELQLSARGEADRWAEIGTYGDGARPILRRNWDLSERCALVTDPDFLVIRGLTVGYAGKGLVVQYRSGSHQGLVIEDCLAHHIEGLYRQNANGIPEWLDRTGAPGDSLNSSAGLAVVGSGQRDVLIRDCEMFQCSWGFFAVGDNVTIDRVYCHHNRVHNTSPHPAMVAVKRSFLVNSLFDAPGWHASAGTMGIMLVDPQGLVIRNCTFRNQPDSGSHDEGGIDFEARGDGCLVEGCTFENNAGAAIEVLGLKSPQPRAVEIAGSRFIQNNVARKLGPSEIYIWGKSSNADVCCSTGLIHGNGYVTLPGIEFFVNEAPQTTSWTLRDNTSYASAAELRRAMPLNDPPVAEAGPDQHSASATVALAGRLTDDGRPQPPRARWEVIEGPGPVTFRPADAAATTAELPVVGDYLLRLVADDGDLWHSDLVAVHRLPEGAATAVAWEFNAPGDKQGWTEADLGTRVRDWPHPQWPTRSEPVQYAAGGFYVVALDNSTAGRLVSPDNLGTDLATAKVLRLRLMNHTPATQYRLRFTTMADPTWDDRKSLPFEVTPNDPAPRAYGVDLSRLATWTGRLKQFRLELATGQPVTGTCRIDYLAVGSGPVE